MSNPTTKVLLQHNQSNKCAESSPSTAILVLRCLHLNSLDDIHDRCVPNMPRRDGQNVVPDDKVHNGHHSKPPGNKVNEIIVRLSMANSSVFFLSHYQFTRLMPFSDASSRAILERSNAFPAITAKNWNPIGTMTIPKAVTPNTIMGSICCRWWRARPVAAWKRICFLYEWKILVRFFLKQF